MKLKRLGSIFLAAAMMTAALTGCGGGDSKAEGGDSKAEGGKSTVTLWATGSDNVRSIFEKLTEDFNTNSEYKDQYQVELQFMLSGTGAQGLADMVAAAGKAGQTNTDYDIVDWSGDDLAKIMSKIGEESFVKLDKSKIPNAASVEAKSAVAQDYAQPYRGTTVILAYDSEKVPTPPKTMDELVECFPASSAVHTILKVVGEDSVPIHMLTPLLDFARENRLVPTADAFTRMVVTIKRKEPDYERFYEVWLPVRPMR